MIKTVVRHVLPATLRMAIWRARHLPWPWRQWGHDLRQWLYDYLPDRYVQASLFKQTFGRPLSLAVPKTFNEKIHWLMLYYRIPEMTQCADKYGVRAFVAERVGDVLLNDLYGVWDDPSVIEFDKLPDSFVLKVTHGCGQNIFCRDKSQLNVERTRDQLAKWMKRSEYWLVREWAYKDIRPRIVCERFLTDGQDSSPPEYKFFCFHGDPHYVQVVLDRFANYRGYLLNLNPGAAPIWEPLPFRYGHASSVGNISRPGNLETMISAARALSRGFPFVRVDLYSIGARVIFGEMTWYPYGGLGQFSPDSYDLQIGQALTLPKPVGSSLVSRLPFR